MEWNVGTSIVACIKVLKNATEDLKIVYCMLSLFSAIGCNLYLFGGKNDLKAHRALQGVYSFDTRKYIISFAVKSIMHVKSGNGKTSFG